MILPQNSPEESDGLYDQVKSHLYDYMNVTVSDVKAYGTHLLI